MDTSDLIKLYLVEPDWLRVDSNIYKADRLASSQFTYVEARAALASAFRAGRLSRSGNILTAEVYRDSLQDFERDWRTYLKIPKSTRLLTVAGDLADNHGLTGSDAVQLASAVNLRSEALEEVQFSVADNRLKTAAIAEGFVVV